MPNNMEEQVRVLFVDDEPNILSSLKRGLIDENFIKYFVTSGDEALDILDQNEIWVIVTDMRMPGMNGFELLKKVSSKHPDVVKIVLSGYNQLPQILATINSVDVYKYIPKPWDMDSEFIPILLGAIEQYRMVKAYKQFNVTLEKKNDIYQKMLKTSDDKIAFLKNEKREEKEYFNKIMSSTESLVKNVMLLTHGMDVKLSLVSWIHEFNRFCVDSYGIESTWIAVDKLIVEVEKAMIGMNSEFNTSLCLVKNEERLKGKDSKVLLPLRLLKFIQLKYSKDLIIMEALLDKKIQLKEVCISYDTRKTSLQIVVPSTENKTVHSIIQHWNMCLQPLLKQYNCELFQYEKNENEVFVLVMNHMGVSM